MRFRRFYTAVAVEAHGEAFALMLDGRAAKTAGGAVLTAPMRALADLLAQEWAGQGEHIDFAAMPATRLAFTAIDRGEAARAGLAKEMARYAAADTLAYPDQTSRPLAARQEELWTPWRHWAAQLGLRFETAEGLLHRRQPPSTMAAVERLAGALDVFTLTGLTYAAGLYGSAILALAVQRGALGGVAAFELSRLEEAFQAEQWGLDAEAEARAAALRREATMIDRWFAALG